MTALVAAFLETSLGRFIAGSLAAISAVLLSIHLIDRRARQRAADEAAAARARTVNRMREIEHETRSLPDRALADSLTRGVRRPKR